MVIVIIPPGLIAPSKVCQPAHTRMPMAKEVGTSWRANCRTAMRRTSASMASRAVAADAPKRSRATGPAPRPLTTRFPCATSVAMASEAACVERRFAAARDSGAAVAQDASAVQIAPTGMAMATCQEMGAMTMTPPVR